MLKSDNFFTLDASGPLQGVNAEQLSIAIHGRMCRYLEERDAHINHAQLNLRVLSAAIDPRRLSALLKVRLEGEINGKKIALKAYAQRTTAGHGAGVAQRLISAAERTGSDDSKSGKLTDTVEGERLDQCVSECTAKLEMQLDQLLGIEESSTAKLWRKLHLAGILLGGVATLLWWGYTQWIGGRNAGMVALTCVSTWILIFLTTHCIAVLCMPSRFFTDDPRGRKAMSRLGTQSIPLARAVSILLMLLLPTIGIGINALVLLDRQSNTSGTPNRNISMPNQPR